MSSLCKMRPLLACHTIVLVLALASLALGVAIYGPEPNYRSRPRSLASSPLSSRQASCSSPTFTPGTLYPVSGTSMAAGDFRGIGVLDLVVLDGNTGNTVTIYSNDGTGKFTQGASFTGDAPIIGVAAGKLVPGSNVQIIVNISGAFTVLFVASDGTITSQSTQDYYGTKQSFTFGDHQAYVFLLTDMNGDGLADIVVSALSTQLGVPVYTSSCAGGTIGNVSFNQPTAIVPPYDGYGGYIGVGDLDGNGLPDLVYINGQNEQNIHLFSHTGNLWQESIVQGTPYRFMAIGHFLGATGADLAINSGGQVQIYLGGRLNRGGLKYPSPIGPNDITGYMATADFNHDGFDDLAVTTNYGVVIFFSDNGAFDNVGTLYPLDTLSGDATLLQGIVLGDFNGDGNTDFAVVRHQDPISGLQIFLNGCPAPPPSTTTTGATSTTTTSDNCPAPMTVTAPAMTVTSTVTSPAITITSTVTSPAMTITATVTSPGTTTTVSTTVTATRATTTIIPTKTITGTITSTVPVTVTKEKTVTATLTSTVQVTVTNQKTVTGTLTSTIPVTVTKSKTVTGTETSTVSVTVTKAVSTTTTAVTTVTKTRTTTQTT